MMHNEEIEVVKKALEFEKQIQKLDNAYAEIEAEEYPPMREAPILEHEEIPYPDVISNLKFNNWWYLLLIWPIVGWIILYFVYQDFKNNKAKHIERIRNSEAYKNKCREVDATNEKNARIAQENYDREMAVYKQELVEYNKKLSEWQKTKDEKLANIDATKEKARTEGDSFYLSTKLVPVKYQNAFALEYIYNFIGYSDYSFKEAADDYERYLDRKMQEAQFRATQELKAELQDAIQGEHAIVDLMGEFIDAYTGIAKKQLLASGINILQTHNANKMAKDRLEAVKNARK